jgi:hypothetical protein
MTSINDVDIAFPESKSDYLIGETWFERTYVNSYRRYGPPIQLVWGANHDALAHALHEGVTRIVYHSPEDRFYYLDHNRHAYCPVNPPERLLALIRAILRRAAEGMTHSEKIVWFQVWDEKAVRAVVDAARALLSVDDNFFNGAKGLRRYISGNYLEATAEPSYRTFAEEQVRQEEDAILTIGNAYQSYWRFCSAKKMPPLGKQDFRKSFCGEAIERFGVGLRHDLRVGDKTAQGWMGLALNHPDCPNSTPHCPTAPKTSAPHRSTSK